MKRSLPAFHGCMLAILSGLLMAACSPEKSNAEERLKPVIVAGKIAEKSYAAALTPEGWVGGRRWSWMGGFSEDGVCLVQEKPDGKFGAIDESGKLILQVEYESASYRPGSFAVQKDKAWGFLNRDGSVAIPFTSDWSGAEPFTKHGLAPVKKGDKWGFIDKQGQFAIPPVYEDAWPHGRTFGLATVMKNGLWGCINTEGKEVISPVWAEAIRFNDSGGGRAAARKEKNGLWGYIDPAGNLVIPLQYEKAGNFSEGIARVTRDSKQMLIDPDGREVFSLRSIKKDVASDDRQDGFDSSDARREFSEGIALIRNREGLYGAIDSGGRIVIPPKYEHLDNCSDGMIAATNERMRGYLKPDGSIAIPFTSDWTVSGKPFKRGLAVAFKTVRRLRFAGYINKEGKFVIPPFYQQASSFNSETGLALIMKEDRCGWIDTIGNERISRSWLSAEDFHSGLAAVQSPDSRLWGYIDTAGKIVIPLQFKEAASFETDGFAKVTTAGGAEKLIDHQGKVVADSEKLIKERTLRNEVASQHIGRINGFDIISHRRGLVKYGIERQGESKTYVLARMDGSTVETSSKTVLKSAEEYAFAWRDEDESNYGLPVFAIRREDGTFTPEFSLPLDDVEDIDETGAHTRTLGHNRYPLFPFPVSPEFADPAVKIPAFRRAPAKEYEKVYFIAWSGLNDVPGFMPLVMETAEWFAQKGAEAHVFFPVEDLGQVGSRRGLADQRNKPSLHDCNIRNLKELIATIRGRHPDGSQVAVVFLIGGHGSDSGAQDGNGYSIVGPARKLADGKEVHQVITQDVLAYLGRVLASYDVRFINGACFGANTTDTFFSSYLKHRAQSGGDPIYACSSVHANWHMKSWGGHEVNTYWPWKFVMSAESSFLRASFAAMWGEWLGPIGTGKVVKEGEVRLFETSISNLLGWNMAMTTSEQIVYFDRVFKLGKFKTEHGIGIGRFSGITSAGSDELDDGFFSLSAGALAAPLNKEYLAIYEESKSATESFLRRLNLGQQTLASLGVGKLGEIEFERISEALKSSVNANLHVFDAELATLFEEYFILNTGYKQFASSSPELASDLSVKLPRFGRLKYSQIVAKLRENSARQNELQNSEFYKKQKVMILIKRLGLMLDFLNDPNVPQKRKDLFAWYRAAELMPLMPPLRGNTDLARDK